MSLWLCVEIAARLSAWSLSQGLQVFAFALTKTRETPEMTALRIQQRRTDDIERCMVYLVEQSRKNNNRTGIGVEDPEDDDWTIPDAFGQPPQFQDPA